jgi:hypothetical protein
MPKTSLGLKILSLLSTAVYLIVSVGVIGCSGEGQVLRDSLDNVRIKKAAYHQSKPAQMTAPIIGADRLYNNNPAGRTHAVQAAYNKSAGPGIPHHASIAMTTLKIPAQLHYCG